MAIGRLLGPERLPAGTPFYYATGLLEYEDYGLQEVVAGSRDEFGRFSQQLFVEQGLSAISPLNQFKVLQNMPLCFVSIEHQLRGDNAVVYSSAAALLAYARSSAWPGVQLIGAGKVYADGAVAVGMALALPGEIESLAQGIPPGEAIELFRAEPRTAAREHL